MRTRQRGHSFYEDEDGGAAAAVPATAASPGRNSPARSVGDASSTDSELSGGGGSRDSGEGGESFVSNDSSASGGSRSSDDLEEDDQAFLRGRSRSRSICGGTPDAPEGLGTSSVIVKYDPANPPPPTGSKENKDVPPVPKSGPLAQHEIQVLKKVRSATGQ